MNFHVNWFSEESTAGLNSLSKIPNFYLISWCGKFVERYSFHRVLCNSRFARNCFFFVLLPKYSRLIGQQGTGEGISLTPPFYLHPHPRHLDISRAITAESSNREPLVSERKSLTTKLRALCLSIPRNYEKFWYFTQCFQ